MIERPVSSLHVDTVATALESQLHAVMHQALPAETFADASGTKQVYRSLLEDSGPDTLLRMLARAVLHDDAVDAFQVEQMREQQPSRPGAHDAHARGHDSLDINPSGAGLTGAQRLPQG